MISVSVSEKIKTCVPGIILSCIESSVSVIKKNNELWSEIEQYISDLSVSLQIEDISRLPAIAASRRAYKLCGKDPARYRLSAEALLRRIVQGKGLYRVNNEVDLLNLVSVRYNFSIGGYDAAKIQGNVTFDIGNKGEIYEGIGRGMLNIESLPVFRDNIGAFGSPTSDSVRTSVSLDTWRFLMIIIDFEESELLEKSTDLAVRLLKKYANAKNIEIVNIK